MADGWDSNRNRLLDLAGRNSKSTPRFGGKKFKMEWTHFFGGKLGGTLNHGLRRCPLPHINIFPWSYGHHIINRDRKSPLIHITVTVACFYNTAGSSQATHLRCYTLHIYQRYFANHGRRRCRYANILHSPDLTTTPINRKSSIPHMDMGCLCWICLILGWRYPSMLISV